MTEVDQTLPWHQRLAAYRHGVSPHATIPQELANAWTAVMVEAVRAFHEDDYTMTPALDYIDDLTDEMVEKRIAGYQCVAPGTRVLRADLRWVPVETLTVGDQLLSFDEYALSGQRRRWRRGVVLEARRVERPAVKLTLSNGIEIIAANDHPWLVGGRHNYKWQETRLLKPGMSLPRLLPVWDGDVSYGAGWLAGMADGEGTISQQFQTGNPLGLAVYQNEGPVLDKVAEELERRGFRTDIHDTGTPLCKRLVILGGKAEGLRFLGSIRPLRLLSKFNLDELGAVKAHNREIAVISSVELVGPQPVIALRVDAGTYLAEGYGAHNSGYDKEYDRRAVNGIWTDLPADEEGHRGEKLRYIFADLPHEVKRSLVSNWDAIHAEWMEAHPKIRYEPKFGYFWLIEGSVVKMYEEIDQGECPSEVSALHWEHLGSPGGLSGWVLMEASRDAGEISPMYFGYGDFED